MSVRKRLDDLCIVFPEPTPPVAAFLPFVRSGNLLFLQKADGAGLHTIQFAQKKARHAAIYRRPSKTAADQLTGGGMQVLVYPDAFPNQGGLPIQVDGQTIGGIACSGAPSEVDEAISKAGIDALLGN